MGCSVRVKTFNSGIPVLHHVRFPLANVVCSLAVALPSVQQRRTQVAHICLQLACVGKPVTLTPPLPLFLPLFLLCSTAPEYTAPSAPPRPQSTPASQRRTPRYAADSAEQTSIPAAAPPAKEQRLRLHAVVRRDWSSA